MKQLEVELKENAYPIYIKSGLFEQKFLNLLPRASSVAIITNDTIAPLYLEKVVSSLQCEDITIIKVPDSEEAKSLAIYEEAMTRLLEAGLNRSSVLIALGGGVIGDLTGFLAATLHRGCRFVQIPTTLLAQVDSSVGGKTGINNSVGKNLIGSFYQPEAVFIDPATLSTLDRRQFSAGMAEVIKYGFIEDEELFDWLVANQDDINQLKPSLLEEMILRCCDIKARVVAADEKEHGQRALLNLGHTFGHAIEQVAGYGSWMHGEAVAVGMLMAMRLAIRENKCPEHLYDALDKLIQKFDLPTQVTGVLNAGDLTQSMLKDKKNLTETLRLILPAGPGRSTIESWNDLNVISNLWQEFGASDAH